VIAMAILQNFFAAKEVILCGGAIKSPHLLLLSGIGDPPRLKQFNIPVISDVPGVGMNLTDHVVCSIWWKAKKNFESTNEWAICQGFGRNDGNYLSDSYPDFQFMLTARKEFIPFYPRPPEVTTTEDIIMGTVAILHPRSSGQLRLKSADSSVPPDIIPNNMLCDEDAITLRKCVEELRRLLNTPLMTELWVEKELAPAKDGIELEEWLRQNAFSMWHPVGTCKMGKDFWAVVDPKLKVKGVKNLRVADASIYPSLPSGNTNAPTMAVGFHAAEIISQEWQ